MSDLPSGAVVLDEPDSPYLGRDMVRELEGLYPGISLSDGFRNEDSNAELRRRGYRPATNTRHMNGEALDISAFPNGLSLRDGAAALREQFPGARVIYGDRNHLDHVHVEFPGWEGAPTLGDTARSVGAENPVFELPEGATVVENDPEAPESPVTEPLPVRDGYVSEDGVAVSANPLVNESGDIVRRGGDNSGARQQVVTSRDAILREVDGMMRNQDFSVSDIISYLQSQGIEPTPEQVSAYRWWKARPDMVPPAATFSGTNEGRGEVVAEGDVVSEGVRDLQRGANDRQRGINALLGAPVDITAAGLNTIPGVDIDNPTGGRETFDEITDAIGATNPGAEFAPRSDAEEIDSLVQEIIGQNAVPGLTAVGGRARSVLERLAAERAVREGERSVLQEGGRRLLDEAADRPGAALATEAGATAGEIAAIDLVEGSDDPLIRAVAPVVGALSGGGVVGVPAYRNGNPNNPEAILPDRPGDRLPPDLNIEGARDDGTIDDLFRRLGNALDEARPLVRNQQDVYHQERVSRLARLETLRENPDVRGRARYEAQLRALSGPMEKVRFEPLTGRFTEDEMNRLFDYLDSPQAALNGFESLNAKTGLARMLDGDLPRPSEEAVLRRVFPESLMESISLARSTSERNLSLLADAANVPRSLMASADMSAPLRQGLYLMGEGAFWKNLGPMFRQAVNPKHFEAVQTSIRERPTYELMQRGKLAITDPHGALRFREEDFMSSLAERIPLVGDVVKFSERGFVGFLNNLRADVFDSMYNQYQRLGIDLEDHPDLLQDVTRYINAASGRGDIPNFMEAWRPALNAALFSPGLISSRMQLLDPSLYITGRGSVPQLRNAVDGRMPDANALVRRKALKNLLVVGSLYSTMASLAVMNGLDIETDPRSSDFLKIRDGTSRHDLTGGLSPYAVLAARLYMNSRKTIPGDILENGEGPYGGSDGDYLFGFLRNKASPLASFFLDYFYGENVIGEEFQLPDAAIQRMIPLLVQDFIEAAQEDGFEGVLEASPAIFGVGYQNFPAVPDESPLRIENNPDSPAAQEINRLEEVLDSNIRTSVRRTLRINGESVRLDDEQYERYQTTSNELILTGVEAILDDPEYLGASDEEREEMINDIKYDARQLAREALFNDSETNPDAALPEGAVVLD